jgi:hypothetical protein
MGEIIDISTGREPEESSISLGDINQKIRFYQEAIQDLSGITLNPANQPERKKNEQELAEYLKNLEALLKKRKELQQTTSNDKKIS